MKGILRFCTFNNALKSNECFSYFFRCSIFQVNNRFRNWYVRPPIPTWDILHPGTAYAWLRVRMGIPGTMAETYSSYVEMGPECDGILLV